MKNIDISCRRSTNLPKPLVKDEPVCISNDLKKTHGQKEMRSFQCRTNRFSSKRKYKSFLRVERHTENFLSYILLKKWPLLDEISFAHCIYTDLYVEFLTRPELRVLGSNSYSLNYH